MRPVWTPAPARHLRRRASHRHKAPAGCRSPCRTSSRINPNALRKSSPGVAICLTRAVGIGTVLAVAVKGRQAGLGGERDQRIRRFGFDPGKATADRARSDRSFHRVRKRIVAAGIDDYEPQMPRRLDCQQDAVKRICLVIDVRIALERGIRRDQVIRPVYLDAVTGVVDDGDVGVACLIGEIAQRAAHFRGWKVGFDVDEYRIRRPSGWQLWRRRHLPGSGARGHSCRWNCPPRAPRACRPTRASKPAGT